MSIFAMYNGLIYNEFFAIPFEIFGSCFPETAVEYYPCDRTNPNTPTICPPSPIGFKRLSFDCVYTIGIDPRWAQSD